MKRFLGLFSVLLVAFLLTGCLAPKVNFTIEPQEIKLNSDSTVIPKITLNVKLSGFSFAYLVEKAVVNVYEEGETESLMTYEKEIQEEIPIILGYKETIEITNIPLTDFFEGIDPSYKDELYDELLKGNKYTLEITLTGKNPTTNTATIIFE